MTPQNNPSPSIEERAKEYAQKEWPIKSEKAYYAQGLDEPYYDYQVEQAIIQNAIRKAFVAGSSQGSEQVNDEYEIYKEEPGWMPGWYRSTAIEYEKYPDENRRIIKGNLRKGSEGDAVEFAEFISHYDYNQIEGGLWIPMKSGYTDNPLSTKQLYQLFLKSKQK